MINWRWFHTAIVAAIVIAIIAIGYRIVPWLGTTITWWLLLALLTSLMLILGHAIRGRLAGALIDERNRMSLSRLQLVVWTIVILSAWLTAVLWNLVQTSVPDPLGIKLPPEIWALLGISTTSTVLQPIILDSKKRQPSNVDELSRNLRVAGDRATVRAVGRVAMNSTPEDASPADLFKGDEVGNFPYLDIGKVQLFLFTLTIVLAYSTAIARMFEGLNSGIPIVAFPPIEPGMLALLAISHAGYLGYKTAPHSKEGDSEEPGALVTTGPTIPHLVDGEVNPPIAPAGTIFRFAAHGFSPNEAALAWLQRPDSTEEMLPADEVPVGNDGNITAIQLNSTGYSPGLWTLNIRGKTSGHVSTIYFLVTQPG